MAKVDSAQSWVAKRSLLKVGSKGKQVKQLETLLKKAGINTGKVDGRFDRDTFEAVKNYQKAKNLAVDGLVGQQTWGSFKGLKLRAGTDMLRGDSFDTGSGGGRRPGRKGGHSHAGGSSGASGTTGGGGASGPGKTVTAYINGSAQKIKVVPVGGGEYMRADAAKNYKAMLAAARRDGISLSSTSGFRTYAEQQALYNQYGSGRAARPGYSNHQNGISMDIGGVNGYGTAAFNWLKGNAGKYGFVNDVPGEFWHWTYTR